MTNPSNSNCDDSGPGNIVYAPSNAALYSWAGTSYGSATALHAATGEGAHDLNTNQSPGTPPVTSTTTSRVYQTAGYYTVTATATDNIGYTSAPSAARYVDVRAA